MTEIIIHEEGCRGCELCIDVCPTEVIEFDEQERIARIREAEDCIGCLSCAYICPPNVIEHNDIHLVQNFYRDIGFSRKLGKFI